MNNLNCYVKKTPEKFSIVKLGEGLIDLLNPILWAKFLFNMWRLLVIPLLIAGVYYFKLHQNNITFIILGSIGILFLLSIVLQKKSIAVVGIFIILGIGGFGIYQYYQGYTSNELNKNVEFTTPAGDLCKIINGEIYCKEKGKFVKVKSKDLPEVKRKFRPEIFYNPFNKQPFGIGLEIAEFDKIAFDLGYFPVSTVGVGASYDVIDLKEFGKISTFLMGTYDFMEKTLGARIGLKLRF